MIKLNDVNTKQQHIGCRGRTLSDPQAITLIALVITIVILIILAGVAINLTVGENGLFRKAQLAKQEYLNAQASEEEQLNELYSYLTRDDLPENTKENPQDIGTIVKLPSNWETTTPNYVSTTDGSVVTKSTKVASVYAVSVGNGNTVPIPVGFWYVGGTLDTGVVISDKYEDSYENNKRDMTGHSDAINLIGNQFVWIPCETKEYKKCNIWNETKQYYKSTSDNSLANSNWDEYTNSAEKMQIEKYGGFYVGRYEAGTSSVEGLDFSVATTGWENDNYTAEKARNTSKATCKAGEIPYFHANYETALTMSERMYNTNSVQSGLITGTQWDVMLNFIGNTEELTSSQWGNYKDYTLTDCTGRYCQVDANGNTSAWTDNTTGNNKSGGVYTILTTGASINARRKNIYDVAGNLWEWSQEAAYYSDTAVHYILRGGSSPYAYANYPACFRWGYLTASFTSSDFGFRVVLYMK